MIGGFDAAEVFMETDIFFGSLLDPVMKVALFAVVFAEVPIPAGGLVALFLKLEEARDAESCLVVVAFS